MGADFRIQHADLIATIRDALVSAGVSLPVATIESEIMAESDLLGVPSHGVRMLPGLIRGIRDGRVKPDPDVKIIRERTATCLLDGDNGPGRFVAAQAMQHAIDRATRCGIGACLATRLAHWGRAHAYAHAAAKAGMIGICTTNAIPNMIAWGSTQPLLGNNPLAIAVPRATSHEPIVLDMAMSQAAVGKIGTFMREGKNVPANWGLDSGGKPSTDPAAILAGRRVLPFGDHKGAGLAFMMELLTGALAGGLLSFEIGNIDPSGLDPGSSKLFIALDVRAFIELDLFARRIDDLIEWLRHSESGLAITLPGERGWQTRERYLREGIPIHPDIVAQAAAAGIRLQRP